MMKNVALIFIGVCLGSLGLLWTAIFWKARESVQVVDNSAVINKVRSSIDALNSRVDQVEQHQLKSNGDVATLQGGQSILWQQLALKTEGQAISVDMTGQGYSSVKTKFGTLVITCVGVEPYLDGQRVRLEIGNPLNATFNGFSLGVSTGTRQTPSTGLKHREVDFVDTLLPGQFTDVSFVVAPATADEVGYLEVSINLDHIALRKPINDQ